MERIDIVLHLPEELAEQARNAGLLTSERIEEWLINELERQRRLQSFFKDLDNIATVEPALADDEILAEIEAYRHEKRHR